MRVVELCENQSCAPPAGERHCLEFYDDLMSALRDSGLRTEELDLPDSSIRARLLLARLNEILKPAFN